MSHQQRWTDGGDGNETTLRTTPGIVQFRPVAGGENAVDCVEWCADEVDSLDQLFSTVGVDSRRQVHLTEKSLEVVGFGGCFTAGGIDDANAIGQSLRLDLVDQLLSKGFFIVGGGGLQHRHSHAAHRSLVSPRSGVSIGAMAWTDRSSAGEESGEHAILDQPGVLGSDSLVIEEVMTDEAMFLSLMIFPALDGGIVVQGEELGENSGSERIGKGPRLTGSTKTISLEAMPEGFMNHQPCGNRFQQYRTGVGVDAGSIRNLFQQSGSGPDFTTEAIQVGELFGVWGEVADGPWDSVAILAEEPEVRLQLPVCETLDRHGAVGVDEQIGLVTHLQADVAVADPGEVEKRGTGLLDKLRPVVSVDFGEIDGPEVFPRFASLP